MSSAAARCLIAVPAMSLAAAVTITLVTGAGVLLIALGKTDLAPHLTLGHVVSQWAIYAGVLLALARLAQLGLRRVPSDS